MKDLKRSNESANYLLPVGQNFLASDPATIKYNAVNAHLLKDRLQNAAAKDKLMILDACREKLELSESKGFAGGEEFRPMDPEHGLMVVHATLHSYLSFGNKKERNSNFTKQLLSALQQQSNQSIFKAISSSIEKVKEANKQLDPKHHQHPRVEGLLINDFCLSNCQTNLVIDPQIQAKEKEIAELKQKLALATPPVEKPSGMSGMSVSKPQGKTFTNSIGMEFVLIPAGSFQMGSNEYNDEKPVHKVEIKQAFYLEKYEVTQKQYQAIMGNNPSHFKGENRPVETVSWNDAQAFIKKLNDKEGKANKYRLPTEAEWEYAARANSSTKWSFGDNESDLKDYAWYRENSNSETHEVGQKKPNGFGLFDMHGNVWEWTCSDYGKYSENKHLEC